MKLETVDCSRGVPMGRAERHIMNAGPVELHLQKVNIDRDGCDPGGAYWGLRPSGINLYWYWWNGNKPNATGPILIQGFIDAASCEEAKKVILGHYPEATFHN